MRGAGDGLERYGISRERQKELEWFCLQYPSKKHELASLSTVSPRLYGGGGGTTIGDPTFRAVVRRERLLKDCDDVEWAANEAIGDDGDVLRRSLIQRVTRRDKMPMDFVPCGQRQFYQYRTRFFVALDQRRQNRGY